MESFAHGTVCKAWTTLQDVPFDYIGPIGGDYGVWYISTACVLGTHRHGRAVMPSIRRHIDGIFSYRFLDNAHRKSSGWLVRRCL